VTFEDLAKALMSDYKLKGNRSAYQASTALRRLRQTFGHDRAVDITAVRVKEYSAGLLEIGLSASSVNYDLAVLRRSFNIMKDTGTLTTAPKITLLPAAQPRQGFLEPPDFARLRDALPHYLQDPLSFLYLSGWRVGEARSLQWRDVDLAGRAITLRIENSKSKQPRTLKLGDGELFQILARAHERRCLDCNFVFHREGIRLGDFRDSWASARKMAGLGHVLIHDLRRSSVRNMVRAGIPERVAMEVSGHRTRTIF
jgi:integrase